MNESWQWWAGILRLAFQARKSGGGGQEPSVSRFKRGKVVVGTRIMSEEVVVGWQKPVTHVSSERGGDRRRHDEGDGMSPSLCQNGREST